MSHPILDKSARIILVEKSGVRRSMLSAGLRELGFSQIVGTASISDALAVMETDDTPVDWIITTMAADEPVNALVLLTLCLKEPLLRSCRVTLITEADERYCIQTAFELGLFSWHERAKDIGSQLLRFADLDTIGRRFFGNDCMIAAHYLRTFLLVEEKFSDLLRLETALASLFPGVPRLALTAAEALFLNDHPQAALEALARAKGLEGDLAEAAQKLADHITHAAGFDPAAEAQFAALNGLRRCIVIDPDESARNRLDEALRSLGVPEIQCFANGEDAWQHLKTSPDPDLIILEWRVPRVSGPMLVQRLRCKGRAVAPIVVYSSLVKEGSDRILLKELGVADVLEKPLTKKQILVAISGIVKEHRRPKKLDASAQRVRLALMARNIPLANELYQEMKTRSEEVPAGLKLELEAQFAYHEGRYEEASGYAIRALHVAGEDIMILNLLGKIYMRLRQFEQAQAFFGRANALSPNNIERLCDLAEARVESGQESGATEALGRAKSLDEHNDRVLETSAKVALVRGDTMLARASMVDLDSLSGIIGFMNNRAVALALTRQLKSSIELYERTLAAIPASMHDVKAIVCYNLALSLAKSGNSKAAEQCLQTAPKVKNGILAAKISSLTKKVRIAAKSGVPVTLNVSTDDATDAELMADPGATIPVAVGVEPGTMRCHLVFQGTARLAPEVAMLISKVPHFGLRAAISRGKAGGKKAAY